MEVVQRCATSFIPAAPRPASPRHYYPRSRVGRSIYVPRAGDANARPKLVRRAIRRVRLDPVRILTARRAAVAVIATIAAQPSAGGSRR